MRQPTSEGWGLTGLLGWSDCLVGDESVAQESTQIEIPVISAKGKRTTVIAVPNPSATADDGIEPELVYGIGGLVVEKVSETEFRDFQGTIWTTE